jgi:NAD(P)-dependent dehydrogenase (short-subunit alcohol dehydrogenase family)
MKHAVITGSSRGIGFGLAKEFLKQGYSVSISGSSQLSTFKASEKLKKEFPEDVFLAQACDVRSREDIRALWKASAEKFGQVDIWVNNAGIGQSNEYFWNLEDSETDDILDINLKGMIKCSAYVYRKMHEQGFGKIYNMEGLGSQGRMMPKVEIYGTTKRGLSYFTKSFAKDINGGSVIAAVINPGMVVTDLLMSPIDKDSPDRKRLEKIINIIGDRVETVSPFLVKKMIKNTKNGKAIRWLTRGKVAFRFLKSLFVKRNVLKKAEQ